MTREQLTAEILELHTRAKATSIGSGLVSREQLEAKLQTSPFHILEAFYLFYEGILEDEQ